MPVGIQRFQDIPFEVIDPAQNQRRACVGLGMGVYLEKVTVPVDKLTKSIYFLHTKSGDDLAGIVTLHYQDGTSFVNYIAGGEVGGWWMPQDISSKTKVAWRGANSISPNIGVYVYGMNNPHPDKSIQSIQLDRVENQTRWLVLGITLCDHAVFFKPDITSYGIPDNWGAAAVLYALMEGLAGIQDTGITFDQAKFCPRWQAAEVTEVTATAKYAASGGYLRYSYQYLPGKKTIFTQSN